jgi:hypothetical protein
VVSLKQLQRRLAEGAPPGRGDEDSVRRLWWAALATLQDDLLGGAGEGAPLDRGVWLASPLPALYEPALLQRLHGWVWTPAAVGPLLQPGAPLLPGAGGPQQADRATAFTRLPLHGNDGTDPLLLLITPGLQVAMALEGAAEARRLLVRFEPGVVSAALELLERRLQHDDPAAAMDLHRHLRDLGPLRSDPDQALRFWPQLAQRLASMAPSVTLQPLAPARRAPALSGKATEPNGRGSELALLEALTHEVRTPLATIRTLIRSLLRRSELTPLVRERLEQIDGECSEQIDRFGLIFLAAEMQRQPGHGQPLTAHELARTDLSQLLEQLEPLWQRQLERRGLSLELRIAAELPPVLSDPTRLETMLGGLVDRFSRSLPSGSQVRLSLRPAGSRLKLQLSSEEAGRQEGAGQQVGPVLSWNPSTGSLQLSRRATQQLFHRLGGRLTERGGGSFTVFFPVAEREA